MTIPEKPWYEKITWPHEELNIHDFSAKALVLDDKGRIPVVKDIEGKRDPVWSLPGGGVEGSELPPETASRELEEETGVFVQPADFDPRTPESIKLFASIFDNHVRYFLVARLPSFIGDLKSRGEEGEEVDCFHVGNVLDMGRYEFLPHHKLVVAQVLHVVQENLLAA